MEKSICFIIYGKNEELIQENIMRLQNLQFPEGYQVDAKVVYDEANRLKAYQQAMSDSKAKYKIYLQEGTFILESDFLLKIIDIFKNNADLGIIGVAGAKRIPTNCLLTGTKKMYGKYYDFTEGVCNYKEVTNSYEEVKGILGFLAATQYDLPWRDDLFSDGYFGVLAHSVEFSLQGYKTGVIAQDNPICASNSYFNLLPKNWRHMREIFLREYSSLIFPLVNILMPTCNRPDLFKIAFESAINQTYKNIEIIISDDGTDNRTAEYIAAYLPDSRIRYMRNPGLTAVENYHKCMSYLNESFEYAVFLPDDDYMALNKISTMIEYYLEDETIGLVTSYRQIVDINGIKQQDISETQKLCEETSRFSAQEMGSRALMTLNNFFGEEPLFKKEIIQEIMRSDYWGRNYYGSGLAIDLIPSLSALMRGDMIYITEPLSFFRMHDGQDQKKPEVAVNCLVSWYYLIKDCHAAGAFIIEEEQYELAIVNYCRICLNLLQGYIIYNKDELRKKTKLLECLNEAMNMVQKILN